MVAQSIAPLYAQIGPAYGLQRTCLLHLQTLPTEGRVNYPVRNLDDLHQLMTAHAVTGVLFYVYGYPARPVPPGAKCDTLLAKLLRAMNKKGR